MHDEGEKVKIKVDPTRTSAESLTTKQLEDIVHGWIRHITRFFRETIEKVNTKGIVIACIIKLMLDFHKLHVVVARNCRN